MSENNADHFFQRIITQSNISPTETVVQISTKHPVLCHKTHTFVMSTLHYIRDPQFNSGWLTGIIMTKTTSGFEDDRHALPRGSWFVDINDIIGFGFDHIE